MKRILTYFYISFLSIFPAIAIAPQGAFDRLCNSRPCNRKDYRHAQWGHQFYTGKHTQMCNNGSRSLETWPRLYLHHISGTLWSH